MYVHSVVSTSDYICFPLLAWMSQNFLDRFEVLLYICAGVDALPHMHAISHIHTCLLLCTGTHTQTCSWLSVNMLT